MTRLMRRVLGAMAGLALCAGTALAAPASKPAKPTEAVDVANCVTAECHANVKDYKVLHGPVSNNTCDACHKLTDARAHTFQLTRQNADLCTYCHEFDTADKPRRTQAGDQWRVSGLPQPARRVGLQHDAREVDGRAVRPLPRECGQDQAISAQSGEDGGVRFVPPAACIQVSQAA